MVLSDFLYHSSIGSSAKPRRVREMDEVKMEEVQSTTKKKRIATRTHTKGLGLEVPFCPMVGSEGYSSDVEITEVLMENFRRAIDLLIKENKEVYVGEVTELTPEGTDSITGGYGKSISHVIIRLKTAKGTKQLKLDPTVHDTLVKEKVAVGDVIYIEANSGAVKRVGRIDALTAEFDLEAEEYVPLPKGEVQKEEIVQDVTLHDLDANAQPQGGLDILSLMGPMMKPRKTEMTDKLRQEINKAQACDCVGSGNQSQCLLCGSLR